MAFPCCCVKTPLCNTFLNSRPCHPPLTANIIHLSWSHIIRQLFYNHSFMKYNLHLNNKENIYCLFAPYETDNQTAVLGSLSALLNISEKYIVTFIKIYVCTSYPIYSTPAYITLGQCKHQCPYRILRCMQLYGGSPTINDPTIINITTSNGRVTSFEDGVYPSSTHVQGVLTIANLQPKQRPWRPSVNLPVQMGKHPLELDLPSNINELLPCALQQRQNDVIVYLTDQRALKITTRHLRELISHGSMTNDSILDTFLRQDVGSGKRLVQCTRTFDIFPTQFIINYTNFDSVTCTRIALGSSRSPHH
jgi:hypothetical protein